MGSYEAGLLYYLIENAKRADDVRPLISTGASAGSINSFISAFHRCTDKKFSPSESLFWKTWIPLNVKKLTEDKEKKANALFTRKSIIKSLDPLKIAWNKGFKKNCTVYLGVTATRRVPLDLTTQHGLTYQRSSENFALKIVGRGMGIPPHVENLKLTNEESQLFLPLNNEGISNFDTIINLLMASSSFPIAFAPTDLKYCFSKKCHGDAIKNDLFIDGGVYNNNPLNLAYKISKTLGYQDKTEFFFLDPDLKNYPTSIKDDNADLDEGILKELSIFTSNFISTARQKELNDFLTDHPKVRDHTFISKGSLPLASKPFYGFFGFFDENFRVFDFNMGMVDAKRLYSRAKLEQNYLGLKQFNQDWASFNCIDQLLHPNQLMNKECSNPKLFPEDQKILTVVSIEKLIAGCKQFDRSHTIENKICKGAITGETPRTVKEFQVAGKEKSESESEVNYSIRRLKDYKYKFSEFGLQRDEADYALYELKEKLKGIAQSAAEQQPGPLKYLLGTLSPSIINTISYDSPKQLRDFSAGHNYIQLSSDHSLADRNKFLQKFRLSYAGGISGVDTFATSDEFSLAVGLTFGLLYELPWITTARWQYRMGMGLGYQLSLKNDQCNSSSIPEKRFIMCNGNLAQAQLAISYIDLIKIKFIYQTLPTIDYTGHAPYLFSTVLGVNF